MSKTMPKGTEEGVAPHLFPSESLLAAVPLHHLTGEANALAMIMGSGIGAAAQSSFTPQFGLAGTVPPGKILVAATDVRLIVFHVDTKFRAVQPAVSFDRRHLFAVRYKNTVAMSGIEIQFTDGTRTTGHLPESLWSSKPFAKATARAAERLPAPPAG